MDIDVVIAVDSTLNREPFMIIRIATDNDQSTWDAYISSNPDAGPYHFFGWKAAVERAYGHKAYYLLAEDSSGTLVGILPLICFRMPWGRKTLISLPYCDYGGPLGNPSTQQALLSKCKDLAQQLGASGIELRCSAKNPIIESNKPFQVLFHKVRMLLTLPGSSEALWNGFKSKLRSQVRRPQKEGLEARLGGLELLDDFYHVFSLNMHALGSPVHAYNWFDVLLSIYREAAKVCVVYLKTGEPVAAGIILTLNKKVCIPWSSSLRTYNRLAPNMLLYWTFLSWATDNGYKEFDFGRSTPNEGTYRFKMQWGAIPKMLYWCRVASSANGLPVFPERLKNSYRSRLRHVAEIVWSNTPSSVVNWIGPRIRKYISL